MAEEYVPTEFAAGYLDGMKKDYLKLKESCALFERDHTAACLRIGLDLDAFNIEKYSEYPAQGIFQSAQLTDRDRQVFGEYLSSREMMYVMEQCVRSISDDDTRQLAEMYYLKRMTQTDIAAADGRTKSYVSKRLDKAGMKWSKPLIGTLRGNTACRMGETAFGQGSRKRNMCGTWTRPTASCVCPQYRTCPGSKS